MQVFRRNNPSTLAAALLLGAFLGAPALASQEPAATQHAVASAAKKTPAKPARKSVAKKAAVAPRTGSLADFGGESAAPDVVHVANWVSYTGNNQRKSFVIIDKKRAQLYVFDPRGKLKSHTPVLLGKAVGDDSAPGIGNKPLSQIKESEKTTPAGRFLAMPGQNTRGDDIIWIDYKAAVSMHRLRRVSAAEHRAERMATPDDSDNRISNGCVNVPPQFFNAVLSPTVRKQGAFIYVLPETRTPQQQFGSYEVPANKVADAPVAARPKPRS